MTSIFISTIGVIPNEFVEYIKQTIERFYRDVKSSLDIVEVYIYSSTEDKLAFLLNEAKDLGVIAIGDFITLHEAWRGWPRIHIDYERCRDLKREYLEALIIHEATHSILHGSLSYYFIEFDKEVINILGFEEAAKALYMASTIIKDIEIHKFLIDNNMSHYVKYYLMFLAENLDELKCDSLFNALNNVKVIAPCILLQCDVERFKISIECLDIVKHISRILNNLDNDCKGDISCKTNVFLKSFLNLFNL